MGEMTGPLNHGDSIDINDIMSDLGINDSEFEKDSTIKDKIEKIIK